MDSLDDVIDGDVEQTIIQGPHLHGAAGQSLGDIKAESGSGKVPVAILFRRCLMILFSAQPELGLKETKGCSRTNR